MAKILIVDDELDDLETMEAVLEKEGYEAITATNGADALDLFIRDGCDLILIDIRMPELSGYELLRLLRSRSDHKAKMLYVSIVPKEEAVLDDIDGFIQKPFSPEILVAEVKKALGE